MEKPGHWSPSETITAHRVTWAQSLVTGEWHEAAEDDRRQVQWCEADVTWEGQFRIIDHRDNNEPCPTHHSKSPSSSANRCRANISPRKIFNWTRNILIITPYIVDNAGPHWLVCRRVQLQLDVGVRTGNRVTWHHNPAQPTFEYKELCCGWLNVC